MTQPEPAQDGDTKLGKWMMVVAWIIGFGLLILFFDDALMKQINPNQSPQSYQSGAMTEVRLQRNRQGHYVSSGFINDQPVTFLLDTGATNVSVPAHLAGSLGLEPGYKMLARTANGTVQVAQTRIDRLRLGDLVVTNVDASLNPGMQGDQILLGMSVLKHLEFTQRGDWLILRSL